MRISLRNGAVVVTVASTTAFVGGYGATPTPAAQVTRQAPSDAFVKTGRGNTDGIYPTAGGYNGTDQLFSVTESAGNVDVGKWGSHFSTVRTIGEAQAFITDDGVMTGYADYYTDYGQRTCFNQGAYVGWATVWGQGQSLKRVRMEDAACAETGYGVGRKVGWDEFRVYY